MASTSMWPLQGATTELAAAAASNLRASNSAVLTLGQLKLHRLLRTSVSFSEHDRGLSTGIRALGCFNGGSSEAVRGGGWLCGLSTTSSRLGSQFVGVGSKNGPKRQLGLLINVVKNSTVCHNCRTKLPIRSLASLSSTTTSYFGGGGGRGIGGRGLGGGGGGGDGFEARADSKGAAAVGGEPSDEFPLGSESADNVIILDVGVIFGTSRLYESVTMNFERTYGWMELIRED
jgi:hypothetical protein